MATQITSKHAFTDNLWLQMAALAIVTLVVIALAAEYVLVSLPFAFIYRGPRTGQQVQGWADDCLIGWRGLRTREPY